ncbi:MAG: A/G-specific adenine glycosylase [Verrucomicrobiales bacterium]|nr:A/G-specific adenine glycosylase [Verrucomicrobiales bacterium]
MKGHRTTVTALLRWFDKNARDLPWRRTHDPYAIWISEIMLQQTQVKTVIPYWDRWMRTLPTVEVFAKAKPQTFLKLWEGLGYYTRVHNAHKAAGVVVEKFQGRFPSGYDDVLALPGIGRYTAGAICSIAFGQPTPIVDGNVIRVLSRLFGIPGNPKDKTVNAQFWQLAQELVLISSKVGERNNAVSHFNQSLMELGALVCTPRKPNCESCPVQKACVAFNTNRVEQLPEIEKRQAATERKFVAFVVEKNNRWLVQQRPAGVVNAHLWEFPNVEVPVTYKTLPDEVPFTAGSKPLFTIRHTITRYRIQMDVFSGTMKADASGKWVSKRELAKLAFSSAHRQIANRINQISA